ncbi:MAG: DEAD/DEAH box helicase [Synergistaceae bacterium]|nr:DEAD/DEAH box helicase [Synergistaceae bacterium]
MTEAYRALPEEEQTAYRLLAVVFVPVNATHLTAILADALDRPDIKRQWTSRVLERWQRAGLAEQCPDFQGEGWCCSRLVTEIAAREALDRKEFDTFDQAAERKMKFSLEERANSYHSVPRYLRAARNVLYRQDVDGYDTLLSAEVHKTENRYGPANELNPLLEILANPVNEAWLHSLPLYLGSTAFEVILHASLGDPERFQKTFAIFEEYRQRHPKASGLTVEWAEFAALVGRIDEAASEMEKENFIGQYCFAALKAILRGEKKAALKLYEEGLKKLHKFKERRKAGFYSWTGVFYPVLLLSSGAPAKQVEDYVNGALDALGGHLSALSLKLLRFFLPSRPQDEDFFLSFPPDSPTAYKPERCVDAFFFLLYTSWLAPDRVMELQPLAEATYRHLSATGLNFLAAELAALIQDLWPTAAQNCSLVSPFPCPLKNLLTRQLEWERSLSALSGIVGKAAKGAGNGLTKGSKRFAWEIAWKSQDRNPAYISLTPLEQTLQASGWSKGKNVTLKKLYKKTDTVPGMTEQDNRAVSAIREERGYYGAEYYIDVPQALEALAGHPYLFREEDNNRIEIVTDEPQLMVVAGPGSYRLKLSPFPKGDSVPQRIIREDGPNCLRVTRFEERHIKIADILGEQGLYVPSRAKETLLKALGSLASIVTVHSDIDGVEANALQVEADPRVYVQLQPSEEGLDADMVVRPLGPNSVPCRAGVGGNNIFGLVEGKRVQARRDLEKEKDALMLAVRECPALMNAEQVADERWHLCTPELALEFLMQVQALGDSVVAEWPKGQTMRVKYQVSMSSMRMSIHGSQEWFALSGELKVDEDLVLSMKDLMNLLKVGYGRFLPIGDGQFLALTKEFRRRLETLAILGDPKGNELRMSPLSVGVLSPLLDGVGSFDGDSEWKRRKARIDEAASLTPALPSTFRGELRNYQLEGYQWLWRLAHWGAGACLADDMGLGKTIQALALLAARGNEGPALVVAPTSVCSNWTVEANRFAPTLNIKELRYGDREKTLGELNPFDVVLTTYGLLQNEIERLSAIHWSTIVLDEAQAIKNMGTKRSAAAMKLMGKFRMATTGTPIENHLGELWNLFRFLNPHFLGSLDSFNRRFAAPIERDGDKDARLRLKKVLQPFILRRNKEQVLEELPPKTEITLRVELKEEEQALYEALRRASVEKLSGGEPGDQRVEIFAELMRLRRACCNAILVMPEESKKKLPSAKLEAFSEILMELRESGHKALVFSQFVDHLTILREYLDGEGVSYQYLDGSTPPQERGKRVAAFQGGEGDCFLISLKAGGTGLNLTAADYVIHMDPWWNPAVEEQASDRAHRIGQNRPVTVYRIVAKNTIEEKIVDLHAWKRDLAESLLDETEAPARLSAEEMLALIRETR